MQVRFKSCVQGLFTFKGVIIVQPGQLIYKKYFVFAQYPMFLPKTPHYAEYVASYKYR